jgi:hypothetical protein
MRRTQVYLPEELHEKVRRISFEQHKSMAQVVRDAVSLYLESVPGPAPLPGDEEAESFEELVPRPGEELSAGELETLKRNPLFHIIGLVSRSYLRDRAEHVDDSRHNDL